MRVLVQRVKNAKVVVNGHDVAAIGKGLLLLVGIGGTDTEKDVDHLVRKVVNLRIFGDEHGKMNLSVKEVRGEILSVSQFTLYADTRKGNRPGFEGSAAPEKAKQYWKRFNSLLREHGMEVGEGEFGAHMELELVNDGPVTIWLDSR